MKKVQGFVAILLSLTTIFPLVSCKQNENLEKSVDVWAKEGHIKVFADKEYDETFRRMLAVNIGACKNEYEASQIILTANSGTVSFYDLEICDLKNADGDILSKENIKIYNQKYIQLDSVTYENTLGTGWYPDALLPFDVAVEYGENKVEEGNNQGVYIETYIPKDAKAGVYSGTFTLNVDEEKYDVPVKVSA